MNRCNASGLVRSYVCAVRFLPSTQTCGCPRLPALLTWSIAIMSANFILISDPGLSSLNLCFRGNFFSMLAVNGLP